MIIGDLDSFAVGIASQAQIRGLQEAAAARTPWKRKREILDLLAGLQRSPEAFQHPGYYFAFAISYLQDEDVLSGNSLGLRDALFAARRQITTVVPKAGSDLAAIDGAKVDIADMVSEFQGGGSASDPAASTAFIDALKVIKATLSATESDGAMIVILSS
jgi:hypothetical protein